MPRNGSSVYSLPAGNPVIAGTVIATAWANSTLTDIATALTQSLSTDGSTASVSLSGKTMSGGTFSGPTVTGTLNLTGGAIQFPAVQVPSANANTLDDYEEGTWTPTFTFATPGNLSVAYSSRVGWYTKIGNLVQVQMGVTTSTWTWTTSSGEFRITGLPFAAAAASGPYGPLAVALSQNIVGASGYQLGFTVNPGLTYIVGAFFNPGAIVGPATAVASNLASSNQVLLGLGGAYISPT